MPLIYKDNVVPINLHNYIRIQNVNTGTYIPVIYDSPQVIGNSRRAKSFTFQLPQLATQTLVNDLPNGLVQVSSQGYGTEEAIRPINELTLLSGSIDNTADKMVIWDASTNTHRYVTPAMVNAPEVFRNNGVLTGVAPAPYKVGIDYSTGTQYYVNTLGNWQAFPPGTTVVLTDLPNGQVNINAGLGGTQNAIRPIDELTLLTGALDETLDRIPLLDNSTGNTVYITPSTLNKDFWRSGAGATTLPDGTTDITETIRRNGNVGLNLDPLTTLDVGGSFSANFRAFVGATTYNFLNDDYAVEMIGVATVTASVVLPNAGLFPRRIVRVQLGQNNTTGTINVTSLGGAIETVAGASANPFVISQNTYRGASWQSDSGNWQLISLIPGNAPVANDFWRSGVGAVALPDGTNDTTENIRRNGSIGINIDPISSIDTFGSEGLTITNTLGSTYTATIIDRNIVLNATSLQTVTLPPASTVARRIHTLVNNTSVEKLVSSYKSLTGSFLTLIPANGSITLQSDGTNWNEIDNAKSSTNQFINKIQTTLTGGGIIRTYGDNFIGWSDRFVSIPNGKGVNTPSTNGYYDITQPPAGTVATGFGGAITRTFTAKGILLNPFEALFYEIPLTPSSNGTINGNYKIVFYNLDFIIPDNWVWVFYKNGDNSSENVIKICNGDSIRSAIGLDALDWNGTVEGYQIDKVVDQNQNVLSGGGTKLWNSTTQLFSWSNRFICLTAGQQILCPSGYWDIIMPTTGNALVNNNSTTWATRPFTATGIQLNNWEALYYILPIGLSNAPIATNYRIVTYTNNARVPSHWILVAVRNSDNNTLLLGTKQIMTSANTLTDQSPYGLFPKVLAKATVLIGDPVAVGARTLANVINVASASGLDGAATVTRMQVVFTTAVSTADYLIQANITSVNPAGYVNDSSLSWVVVSKSTTGFVVVFRETLGVAQNINFDFAVINYN